ncbi:MAG: CidA/LrgA family protein [Candidatus Viridilinea halotolerans]|uniref:CidA/LrgA family protein n=1 Tax=Candidatus Viridilinea halotolerans TaxID=2491704 RepID=A0A426TVA2_9CHLR|nr:MAG: CidA/LrgA family protein [Candidatus Viridilinea halotolerans]
MINAILALLTLQLTGEILVRAFGWPLPGPVVGMLLLFVALKLYGRVPSSLQRVADGLLANLALLFVPAGVGVMLHFELIAASWWQLLLTLVVSTVVTLLATATVMQGLLKLRLRRAKV